MQVNETTEGSHIFPAPAESAGRAREATMELHAPQMWVFLLSLVIAVIAVVGVFTPIPYVTAYGFWVAIVAYLVLALGNWLRA
jgi:hypothetical protein